MLATALAAMALAVGPTSVGHMASASGPDMQLAFQAAFGSASTPVRAVHDPVGGHETRMTLQPKALVDLGTGTYALVVFERNEAGFHFEPGAIAMVYLSLAGTDWKVIKVYPEFIWAGNNGEPADTVTLLAIPGGPILVISSEYIGQGQHSTTGWLIKLSAQSPSLLGHIPVAGFLEADACTKCLLYDYASNLDAPSVGASVLSAHYIGWKEMSLGVRSVIDEVVQYTPTEGGLEATHDPGLPDVNGR